MKTIIPVLAVLSAVATAVPAHADSGRHLFISRARDFQAVEQRMPRQEETGALAFGVGEDSHDTETGGPSGGLVDRN